LDGVTFRGFLWSDIPAITAIYRHAVETDVATFDTEAPGETAMAEKFGHLADLSHPVTIADRGGTCVGYSYASIYRPRPAYRFTCEDSIYLAPEAQGQGLGSRLLAKLIADSRAFGFKQMIAVISAEKKNSVRVHEKLGFELIGLHPKLGYKFDRWLDIVHMQLAL
jgi:phosphinothricin acetyltransferase